MSARNTHHTAGRVLAAGTMLAALLAAAAPARAQGGIVYYQVSYKDGSIRDLAATPATDKGIKRVVRISRHQPDSAEYRVLATGPTPLTVARAGRTPRVQLVWDGKAWVAPRVAEPRRPDAPRPKRTPAEDALGGELRRVAEILKGLEARVRDCDLIIARGGGDLKDIEKTVTADEKTKAARAKEVRESIAWAQRDREICLRAAKLVQTQRAALRAALNDKRIARPAGKVDFSAQCPLDKGAAGIRKFVTGRRVLPHRTQVWKLPPGKGRRTVEVAMAHPEAGPYGEFYYVAYADTDGDGVPDKLLARSPAARAATAGGWSAWRITIDEPAVYIGNSWPFVDTTIYCQRTHDVSANWNGLSREIYVSGFFGGMPTTKRLWPYLSNIRVRFPVRNPDVDLP